MHLSGSPTLVHNKVNKYGFEFLSPSEYHFTHIHVKISVFSAREAQNHHYECMSYVLCPYESCPSYSCSFLHSGLRISCLGACIEKISLKAVSCENKQFLNERSFPKHHDSFTCTMDNIHSERAAIYNFSQADLHWNIAQHPNFNCVYKHIINNILRLSQYHMFITGLLWTKECSIRLYIFLLLYKCREEEREYVTKTVQKCAQHKVTHNEFFCFVLGGNQF